MKYLVFTWEPGALYVDILLGILCDLVLFGYQDTIQPLALCEYTLVGVACGAFLTLLNQLFHQSLVLPRVTLLEVSQVVETTTVLIVLFESRSVVSTALRDLTGFTVHTREVLLVQHRNLFLLNYLINTIYTF